MLMFLSISTLDSLTLLKPFALIKRDQLLLANTLLTIIFDICAIIYYKIFLFLLPFHRGKSSD